MVKTIDNQRSPNDRIEVDNITLDENTISSQIGNLILNPASDIDCSNKKITNLLNPEDATDAATKAYVDSIGASVLFDPSLQLSITNDTESNSTSTGSITTLGGIGVAKNIYCGKKIQADEIYANSIEGGSIQTQSFDADDINCTGNAESTNKGTGSIVTAGGLGVAKNINCSSLLCSDPTNSTSINNGSLRTYGGMAIAKDLRCNGKVYSGGLTVTAYSDPLVDHTPVALFQTLTPVSGDVDSSVCIKSKDTGESNLFLTNTNTTGTEHKTWCMYLEKASGDLRFNYGEYDPLSGEFGSDNKLTIKTDGSITAASNTFRTSIFGFAAVGNPGHTGFASFSHSNNNNTTNYALMQNSSGNTILNAVSGQNITFRNNNEIKMTMTDTLLSSSIPITCTNDTASTSKTTGSITTAGGLGVAGDIHCNNIYPSNGIKMVYAMLKVPSNQTTSGNPIPWTIESQSVHNVFSMASHNIRTSLTGVYMINGSFTFFGSLAERANTIHFRYESNIIREGITSHGAYDGGTNYGNVSMSFIHTLSSEGLWYNFFWETVTGGSSDLRSTSNVTILKIG